MEKIDELDRMIKCEINLEIDNKLLKEIEKSNVVVIFLTDNCFSSQTFRKQLDFAKKERKLLIPVLMNNSKINDSIMQVIDFKDILITEINDQMYSNNNDSQIFKQFRTLMFHSLQINKDVYFDTQLTSIKKVQKNFESNEIEFISKNEILLRTYEKGLRILNISTGIAFGEIINDEIHYYCCWIDHLCQILILMNNEDLSLVNGEFYNKNGELVNKILFENCEILGVLYEKTNKKTYIIINELGKTENTVQIFDENFKNISNRTISFLPLIQIISGKNIFVSGFPCEIENESVRTYNFLLIFDLSYNYLASIAMSSSIQQIFIDSKKQSNFIFINTQSRIEIFNTNTFSLVGFIETPPLCMLKMIHNEKLYFSDSNEHLLIYKTNFKKLENFIDMKYMCKINPLRPHLYSNPYLLPCGNSVCLDCIYDNYNIYKRIFTCNFESCQGEHKLIQQELKENLKLKEMIHKELNGLVGSIIELKSHSIQDLNGK